MVFMNELVIPYTLCFCIVGNQVLLLHRRNAPNAGLWNGVGGKIEKGESAVAGVYREVWEEAGIDLRVAEVTYGGVVCWNTPSGGMKGMYCFVAYPPVDVHFSGEQEMSEGTIAWKDLTWVLHDVHASVVSNIPYFLFEMLHTTEAQLYACTYEKGVLQGVQIGSLPAYFLLS
jgi:8-oxo-dGTP diphosphatase